MTCIDQSKKTNRQSRTSRPPERAALGVRFAEVRALTEELTAPLSPEDQQVQSADAISPTKWHLAHVCWLFETLVLGPHLAGYELFHPRFGYLFNSYYESLGARHARHRRGLISRPSIDEIMSYRSRIDAGVAKLIDGVAERRWPEIAGLIEIGLHHEQQHQELILAGIKHLLWCNPLAPAYAEPPAAAANEAGAPALAWHDYAEGIHQIGHAGEGFAHDNERPRHRVFAEPFGLAARPVTNAEYREFVADGGYDEPAHWLYDGWRWVAAEGVRAPLYWRREDGEWRQFTLHGLAPLDGDAPVCHVSYYEADAFARWAGARLPGEAEWEIAAEPLAGRPEAGANLLDSGQLRPRPAGAASRGSAPGQMIGDVWEWTRSAHAPYPGFRLPDGPLGEYNAKFMCNTYVMRGGSCLTPPGHIRITYRNFFYPRLRIPVTGFRLARDA